MDSVRIADFIKGFSPAGDGALRRLRDKAERDGVPVIREETEAFLLSVLALLKPERILELGTATGYSAIMMAKGCGSRDLVIDTIEDWHPRVTEAVSNIEEAGLAGVIRLIEGDALSVMKEMEGTYDLVFIDAAKGQYPEYLKEVMRLTHRGSVIAADNVFMGGEIMESKFIVERRDRTIHKRMREFLDMAFADERLVTSIVPTGDGVAFCVRDK